MCGFLLLIRKSQGLSAQNRKVYCDWWDCLSRPRLLRKTGGLVLCLSAPVPSLSDPMAPPRAQLPHSHPLHSLQTQTPDSGRPAPGSGAQADVSGWVLGSSREEPVPGAGPLAAPGGRGSSAAEHAHPLRAERDLARMPHWRPVTDLSRILGGKGPCLLRPDLKFLSLPLPACHTKGKV